MSTSQPPLLSLPDRDKFLREIVPSLSSRLFTQSFALSQSSVIRAIAYNADFSVSAEAASFHLEIPPTLIASTGGGGTVAIAPPDGAYYTNSTAIATATPNPGWVFLQWLGDIVGTNPVAEVTMNRNKCAEAVFGTVLNVAVPSGSGSVSINPPSVLYPFGSTVRLSVIPGPGHAFALWGNAVSGDENPLSITLDFVGCAGLSTEKTAAVLATGSPGDIYRVEGSSNLVEWSLIGIVTNWFGTVQANDVSAGGSPSRFYRAVQIP